MVGLFASAFYHLSVARGGAMRNHNRNLPYFAFAAALIPAAAHADMVWPALFLEPRLLSIPIVVVGLLIEAAVLHFCFQMDRKKAIIASVVVNAISTLFGVVLIPLAGIAWEFFPGILLYKALNMGTFNPFTWAATFILAATVTTAIEVVCLRYIFKVPLSRRTWGLWYLANSASVGLAFLSFIFQPMDEVHFYHPWLIG